MRSRWILIGLTFPKTTRTKGEKKSLCRLAQAGTDVNGLSEEDIQVLYEKDLLGSSTAEALLNTVWFNNTIHFGLQGCKEHREMCWGDVKLC